MNIIGTTNLQSSTLVYFDMCEEVEIKHDGTWVFEDSFKVNDYHEGKFLQTIDGTTYVVTTYQDGVSEIPRYIAAALEKLGYNVTKDRVLITVAMP